jgi:hypothetical protein
MGPFVLNVASRGASTEAQGLNIARASLNTSRNNRVKHRRRLSLFTHAGSHPIAHVGTRQMAKTAKVAKQNALHREQKLHRPPPSSATCQYRVHRHMNTIAWQLNAEPHQRAGKTRMCNSDFRNYLGELHRDCFRSAASFFGALFRTTIIEDVENRRRVHASDGGIVVVDHSVRKLLLVQLRSHDTLGRASSDMDITRKLKPIKSTEQDKNRRGSTATHLFYAVFDYETEDVNGLRLADSMRSVHSLLPM